MVALAALNAMGRREFVGALGDIFEHAPWIAEGAYPARPFASIAALHRAMLAVLDGAGRERLLAFLNGHPDLGGRVATDASAREQAGAGLGALSPEEAVRLAEWNRLYRARFGFPFILCAARHDRASILAAFERRLAGDPAAEYATALAEIAAITALRLAARVEDR